jgi:hypothetical protein
LQCNKRLSCSRKTETRGAWEKRATCVIARPEICDPLVGA